MRKLLKSKKGQVLVISLAVIFLIFVFVIAAVETGNLMYEKAHMQNIADSGAMEGGMWYARGMNILALSNKVLAVTGVAAVVASLFGAYDAGKKAVEFVQKAQDVLAGTGTMEKSGIKAMPFFCAAAVLLNGKDNKVLSIPLHNLEDYETGRWMPSFNVKRRYADSSGNTGDEDKYYYRKKSTGEKVYVEKESVVTDVSIRNKHKKRTLNHPVHGNRFLSVEKGSNKEDGTVPLDIVESSQEHSVLVVSCREKKNIKQITSSGLLKDDKGEEIRPDFLLGFSFVRVSGGSLDILELDGANYEPFLEHIQFPVLKQTDGLAEAAGGAADNADEPGQMVEYLNSAIDILNGGLILH